MIKKFTLIELLVVVAIIGILVSMLLPSLSKARNEAKSVLCVNNLRTLAIGVLEFSTENDGGIIKTVYSSPGVYTGWEYGLKPYLGDDYINKRNSSSSAGGAAHCPAYEPLQFQFSKAGGSALQVPDYGYDSDGGPSRGRKDYLSYGINQFLSNMQMNDTGYPGNGTSAAGSWYSSFNKQWLSSMKSPPRVRQCFLRKHTPKLN